MLPFKHPRSYFVSPQTSICEIAKEEQRKFGHLNNLKNLQAQKTPGG
jgi:hypothetical protein